MSIDPRIGWHDKPPDAKRRVFVSLFPRIDTGSRFGRHDLSDVRFIPLVLSQIEIIKPQLAGMLTQTSGLLDRMQVNCCGDEGCAHSEYTSVKAAKFNAIDGCGCQACEIQRKVDAESILDHDKYCSCADCEKLKHFNAQPVPF